MSKNDIIFSALCGLAVAWIATDFAPSFAWAFLIFLPILSVAGLLLCDILGKKFSFVRQAGRFALSGAFADVVDIKVFQFLFWILPFSLLGKTISFLIAMAIKFWANKHWSFERHENDGIKREMAQFSLVTLIGLAIDVVSFYYFSKIRVAISVELWTELCIIFAALAASVWNFLGYKFLVFKK